MEFYLNQLEIIAPPLKRERTFEGGSRGMTLEH